MCIAAIAAAGDGDDLDWPVSFDGEPDAESVNDADELSML
jgi:hypothetical protein